MKYSENSFFKLFANCIPVKGISRSTIYDIQRESLLLIPNDLYDIIEKFQSKTPIKKIYDVYGDDNKEILDEYFDFILKNELGFVCTGTEFDFFPDLDLKFNTPSLVSNAVIELGSITIDSLNELINQLEELGCKDVQLISYEILERSELKTILKSFEGSRIKCINLLAKFSETYDDSFFEELILLYLRLNDVVFFAAKEAGTYEYERHSLTRINFTEKNYSSFSSCGVISSDNFSVNMPKFTEAFNHNSCLNRKISINKHGEIQNCPAMKIGFGNINSTKLKSVIKNSNFRALWNLNKDKIEICKDCEFRYACTDCRAFIENPQEMHSKPLKCGYSPYTNKWEEWSANPLKKKAIDYYGIK